MTMMFYPLSPLQVLHRVRAGSAHVNVLPPAPEGRELRRIWTVIDLEKLCQVGPIHNRTGFLEDFIHDWRVRPDGTLSFYSRVVEIGQEVDVLLDYETIDERRGRTDKPKFDPNTGEPISG